jgi:hypothetical protein
MFSVNREEIAFAAGLFEGEGCFVSTKSGNRTRRRSQATINMTDREPLEHLVMATGLGRVTGPVAPRGSGIKPSYNWGVYTFEHVQALAAMFWPWLSPRRRARVQEVLAADESRPLRTGTPACA